MPQYSKMRAIKVAISVQLEVGKLGSTPQTNLLKPVIHKDVFFTGFESESSAIGVETTTQPVLPQWPLEIQVKPTF